jgi:tetratricopeptide (TPR) repeat protein
VGSFDEIAADLRTLRRRTFGELDERALATRLPTLAAAANHVYGPPAPIRRLLTAAARRVVPDELRPAVTDLFGLGQETYGRTLAYRQDKAAGRFDPRPTTSTFRQSPKYSSRLVDALATAVVELLSDTGLGESGQRGDRELIDRDELVTAGVRALTTSGPVTPVLWIHGEPGTGKTVLADLVAGRLATARPAVRIRLANSRVMQEDLALAVDDATLDEATRVLRFRRMVAESGTFGVLVLDDAADPRQVADLNLPPSRTPVIVTSRHTPPDGATPLLVGDFGDEQTAEAVHTLMPDIDDDSITRLAAVSGGRPLVVNHICQYLRSTGTDPKVVLDGLAADTARTLDAIGSTTDRGLTAVYRGMLDDLAELGDAVPVLDSLIWLAFGGLVNRSLADGFLAHRFPGPAGSVQVSAALVVLARRGLLTEEQKAFRIHALTTEMLRLLRRGSMTGVYTDLVDFLLLEPPETDGSTVRELLHGELVVTADLLAGDRLLCLAEKEWLWLRHGSGRPSATRYRTHSTGVTAWCDDALARPASGAELDTLVEHTSDYQERTQWLYEYAVGPSAEPTTEGNGYVHVLRKGWESDPRTGLVTNSWRPDILHARCGVRWRVRQPAERASELPSCPRCAEVTFMTAVRAWGATGVRTTRRRLLADLAAAVTANDIARAEQAWRELQVHVEHINAAETTTLLRKLAKADTDLAGLVRSSDPDRALALYQSAAEKYGRCAVRYPDDPEPLDEYAGALGSVVALLERKDRAAAAETYRELIAINRRLLALRPDDPWAKKLLGLVLTHHARLSRDQPEQIAEAIDLFRQTLTDDPYDRELLGDALAMLAGTMPARSPEQVAAHAEAAEHRRHVLKAHPDDPARLERLVLSLYRVADARRHERTPENVARWAELEELQRQLLALRPDNVHEVYNLAVILMRRSESGGPDAVAPHAEATALFASVPNLHPDDPATILDAAHGLDQLAKANQPTALAATDSAIQLYRRYLMDSPDDRTARVDLCRLLLDHAQLTNSETLFAEAAHEYRTVHKVQPRTAATQYGLATALTYGADFADAPNPDAARAEAVTLLREALAEQPGTVALLVLAHTLDRQADTNPQEAEQLRLEYVRRNPRDPAAHYELARMHARRGDARRAAGRLATWWRTSQKPVDRRRHQVAIEPDFDLVRGTSWFARFQAATPRRTMSIHRTR